MLDNKESNSLSPYTYFNHAPTGITVCTDGHGMSPDDPSRVQGSLVYLPVAERDANRVRLLSSRPLTPNIDGQGVYFRKILFDGSVNEELRAAGHLAEVLTSLYQIDVLTGQRVIEIPIAEIDELFDPRESLLLLFAGEIHGFPHEVKSKIERAVGNLLQLGIPFKDIGLYGGMQTFISHYKQHTHLKDIDLLVYGIEHVDVLIKAAKDSQIYRNKSPKINTRVKQVDETLRARRHQNSRIYLPPLEKNAPEQAGVFCDIKVVRKKRDPLSFSKDVTRIPGRVFFEGVVVDASESLSMPFSFVVRTKDGDITVSSTRYDFVGTVDEQDRVIISGARTNKDNHVLLTDPVEHGIQYF